MHTDANRPKVLAKWLRAPVAELRTAIPLAVDDVRHKGALANIEAVADELEAATPETSERGGTEAV